MFCLEGVGGLEGPIPCQFAGKHPVALARLQFAIGPRNPQWPDLTQIGVCIRQQGSKCKLRAPCRSTTCHYRDHGQMVEVRSPKIGPGWSIGGPEECIRNDRYQIEPVRPHRRAVRHGPALHRIACPRKTSRQRLGQFIGEVRVPAGMIEDKCPGPTVFCEDLSAKWLFMLHVPDNRSQGGDCQYEDQEQYPFPHVDLPLLNVGNVPPDRLAGLMTIKFE